MSFILDKRGGHNRKDFNRDFFKTWSPPMAYVLGYLYADGTLIDPKPSRTCYVRLTSIDKEHLEKINLLIGRKGKIYSSEPRIIKSRGKTYISQTAYYISIGSRELFNDLIRLGLTERKSLTVNFPFIQTTFLPYFLRGNLDGDGCIYIGNNGKRLQVIFNSGSKNFLKKLSELFTNNLPIKVKNTVRSSNCFQLRYSTIEAVKILDFIYKNLDKCPYLERKYLIYKNWRGTQMGRGVPAKHR